MGRTTLQIDYDYEFGLLAIVTPMRDYRLCYFINKYSPLELIRRDDLSVTDIKKRTASYFSIYSYSDLLDHADFYLVNNKNPVSNKLLLPELRQIDYLFKVVGNAFEEKKKWLNRELNLIPQIQTCFEVDINSINSKQNLIFDDEDV